MRQKYFVFVWFAIFVLAASVPTSGLKSVEDNAYYLETYLSSHILYPGENRTYEIQITNPSDTTLLLEIRNNGAFGTVSSDSLSVSNGSKEDFFVSIRIPENVTKGVYYGSVELKGANIMKEVPYVIEIRYPEVAPQFFIALISQEIYIGDPVRVKVNIVDETRTMRGEVRLRYTIKSSITDEVIYEEYEDVNIFESASFIKSLFLNSSTKNNTSANVSTYYVEFFADYGAGTVLKHTDSFEVYEQFWTEKRTKYTIFAVIFIAILSAAYYAIKWYRRKKKESARYVFPLSYNMIPDKSERSFWVGNIAETKIKSYVNPEDLVTHTIVAGSTGAGKSVTASLIAEEALLKNIPVVVFDPTAQWTGFVRKCSDKNLLNRYKAFGLNPEDDPRPFHGLIKEVTSAKEKYDFKKLMNKGEITVFTLNQLTVEEFDEAVTNIINDIFAVQWEEKSELRLIVVFDEVHRLLETYGGGTKGGYRALERGAREFRKWGIGLLLCSQVTSDFKAAVSGNIMTEIQMQTKSMQDIERAKKKYGPDYAKRIASEEIGTGMVQNPKYNKGKPWFVNFRPTLHNPHKILDEELRLYDAYYKEIEQLEETVEALKARKSKDAYDLELEIKLAKNSLKEGRFKMCELYLEEIRKRISSKHIYGS